MAKVSQKEKCMGRSDYRPQKEVATLAPYQYSLLSHEHFIQHKRQVPMGGGEIKIIEAITELPAITGCIMVCPLSIIGPATLLNSGREKPQTAGSSQSCGSP